MKQVFTCLTVLFFVSASLCAQGHPSSKGTAVVGKLNFLESSTSKSGASGLNGIEWAPLMSNSIKVSQKTDLFIDVSLESSLFTRTLVRSKGSKDSSKASASVRVRVLVDGKPAHPADGVVFNARSQTLTALFQGIFIKDDGSTCLEANTETGAITVIEDCLEPEELDLVLETMSANAFNFLIADLSSGVHKVEVQAAIQLGTSSEAGAAEAMATIGNGSVTVEAVKLIHGEDYEL